MPLDIRTNAERKSMSYYFFPENIDWYKYTPTADTVKMFHYAQKSGIFTCPGNYIIKRKARTKKNEYNSIMVGLTIEGTGYLHYSGKRFKLTQGCGFILNCNYAHKYYTDKHDLWKYIWLHFYGGQCVEQTAYIQNKFGPVFFSVPDGKIESQLREIFNLGGKTGQKTDILINGHITNIISEIMLSELQNSNKLAEIPPILNQAIFLIENNYKNNLKLDELAEKVKINKYKLIRLFKRYMDRTPYEYLIYYRIQKAKILLSDVLLSVKDIAGMIGIKNVSYFIKTFKYYENLTPAQYRKNI